jgi:translation initiation factor IF-2
MPPPPKKKKQNTVLKEQKEISILVKTDAAGSSDALESALNNMIKEDGAGVVTITVQSLPYVVCVCVWAALITVFH